MHAVRRALRITFGRQYRIVKALECLLVIFGMAVVLLTSIHFLYVPVSFFALSVVFIGLYAVLSYKSPGHNFTQNKIENRPLLILHYTVPVFGWVYCGLCLFYQIHNVGVSFYAFYVSNIIFIPFATWFITSAVKTKPIPDARLLHCIYYMAAFFITFAILSVLMNVFTTTLDMITCKLVNIETFKVISISYFSVVALMLTEMIAILITLSKELHERLIYFRTLVNQPAEGNTNQQTVEEPIGRFRSLPQKMRLLLRNNRVAFGLALLLLLMTPLVIVSHLNIAFEYGDQMTNWTITCRWNCKLTDTYFIVIYLTYSIGVMMSVLYFMRMKTWIPTKITKYLTDVIVIYAGTVVVLVLSSIMIYALFVWKNMTDIRFYYFMFAKICFNILQVTSQFMTSREMLCKNVDTKGYHGDGNAERINAEERNRLDKMVAPSLILCLTNFILFIDNMLTCISPIDIFINFVFINFYRLHGFLFFLNVVCMKLEFYSND